MGHHLIMGRVTYESIGRLLPGRTMIVITRQQGYQAPGCLVTHTIKDALDLAEKRGETEAFIIGGAQIYSQSLHLVERLYLTRVHTRTACDVSFPELELEEWQEMERQYHPADENNEYSYTYSVLEKV
jgi:dihydrofolate reductase